MKNPDQYFVVPRGRSMRYKFPIDNRAHFDEPFVFKVQNEDIIV